MSWQALAAGIQLRIALMSVGLSSICPHTTAHDHVDITMAVSLSSASAIKRNLPTKGAGVLGNLRQERRSTSYQFCGYVICGVLCER